MGVITWVLGWGGLGVAARMYQLGLGNHNPFRGLHWHAVSGAFWGFAGYHFYYFNENNLRIIEAKKLELARRRGFLPYPGEEEEGASSSNGEE
ncbi:hypothetical protein BT69DRAFT_1278792 [Atractiella rhizophila]|nr:hypothetical protein BT69DRAFT_1278792 [Atractiella rhizophila]